MKTYIVSLTVFGVMLLASNSMAQMIAPDQLNAGNDTQIAAPAATGAAATPAATPAAATTATPDATTAAATTDAAAPAQTAEEKAAADQAAAQKAAELAQFKKDCEAAQTKASSSQSPADKAAAEKACARPVDTTTPDPQSSGVVITTPKSAAEAMMAPTQTGGALSVLSTKIETMPQTDGFAKNFGGAEDLAQAGDLTTAANAKTVIYSANPVQYQVGDKVAVNLDPTPISLQDHALVNSVTTGTKVATTSIPSTNPDGTATSTGTVAAAAQTATQMLESGQWPTTKAARAALTVQYLREKGYSEAVIKETMSVIYKEDGSLSPTLKNPDSTAVGIGQYVNKSWLASGGTMENRYDPQAQIDVLANDINKRYTAYTNGTLAGCSSGMAFTSCDYVYHYAGSFNGTSQNIAYALNYTANSASGANNLYANAVASLDGKDVSSVLAGMQTEQLSGLGSSVATTLSSGSTNNAFTSTINSLLGGTGSNYSTILGSIGSTGLTGTTGSTSLLGQLASGVLSGVLGNKATTTSTPITTTTTTTTSAPTTSSVASEVASGYAQIVAKAKQCGVDLPQTAEDAQMLMIKDCQS